MASFRQVFASHALEILTKPKYRNWKSIVQDKPGFGIMAVGPDKMGIVRTWKITPSGNYPMTPPVVVSEPPYVKDICWDSSGVLHYTRYAETSGSPWEKAVKTNANPLFTLIVELLQKYKLAV
jgi:hypothetical protein